MASKAVGENPILKRLADDDVASQPRAKGTARLTSKRRGSASVIDDLRTSGCMRILFPRAGTRLEGLLVNTAGGLTGGDRIAVDVSAGTGSHLTVTSQAAERAYRAASGTAQVTNKLSVASGARLHWVPQELILFDGAALDRRLRCDLAIGAQLLLVEPVIFGRALMGEALRDVRFQDRVHIRRDGQSLYRDGTELTGDAVDVLRRKATGGGAGAMASLIYVAPDAEAHLDPIRNALPDTAGASLIQSDVLVLRALAADGFALRKTLLPVLDRLSQHTLPTSWRL